MSLTAPLARPLAGPITCALTAARVSAGGEVTLESLLAEAGTADWDMSVGGSLFQNSNGTTAVADGDPIGYIADQTGHGLHLVQATAGKRGIKSSRSGVPMVQLDHTNDEFTLPVGVVGVSGTLAFATRHGPRCYPATAPEVIAYQFSRMMWFPRALTTEETDVVLAELGGVFETTHDLEMLAGELTLSAYFAYSTNYTSLDDPAAITASHIDFETSANSGNFPPWASGYLEAATSSTAREGADFITTAASIESIEVCVCTATDEAVGPALDVSLFPALKVWSQVHSLEGPIPPVEDWSEVIEYVNLGKGNTPAKLTGVHPTGAELATRPSLRFIGWDTDTDGLVPSTGSLPALEFAGWAKRRPWTGVEPGFTVAPTVKQFVLGSGATTAASVVNAVLAGLRTAAVTGCTVTLVTGMAAPTGQGIVDAQWLRDNGGNTVTTA